MRRFQENSNEEVGGHRTLRNAAKRIFLLIAEEIKSRTYLLYGGPPNTGVMITIAQEN